MYLLAGQMFGSATPDEGLRTLDELSDDMSDSRLQESALQFMGAFYAGMRGAFEEARRSIALADDIAEAVGSVFALAAHAEGLGHLEVYAGDAEAAERAFRRSYETLDEIGDEGHKSTGAANLAKALCDLGRFEEAEPYVEIALRAGAEDDLATQAPARSAQAIVHAARGEFAEAERLAREAVDLYARAESPNSMGDAWMDLARVLRTAGKHEDAGRAAREALALYERKGNRPASDSTRAFIDALGPSRG
jgi:tetratricopeptide (TPR) repeat protein